MKTPTANISLFFGDTFSHWVYGTGKVPALRAEKESGRIKPFKSHRPNGIWKTNQGALVR